MDHTVKRTKVHRILTAKKHGKNLVRSSASSLPPTPQCLFTEAAFPHLVPTAIG